MPFNSSFILERNKVVLFIYKQHLDLQICHPISGWLLASLSLITPGYERKGVYYSDMSSKSPLTTEHLCSPEIFFSLAVLCMLGKYCTTKSPASAQETLGKGGGDLISPNWATNIILGSVLLVSSCSSWHCESAALVWIDSLWWQTTEWPDLSSSSSSHHSHAGNPRSGYRFHLPCLLECVDILIPKSTGQTSVQTQLLRKWIRRKWCSHIKESGIPFFFGFWW